MRQRFHTAQLLASLLLIAFSAATAVAQAPVSILEQLQAQYKVAKLASDTSGYSVTEEGTLLAIQKGGLLGVPYSEKTTLTNKYESGTVHPPSSLLVSGKKALLGHFSQTQSQGQTTKLFNKGDKVYPTKIDVSPDKDTVTMGIVACDKCNNTDPPTYNKTNVVFQFPKGSLAKASAGEVEDTIGQLLAISDDAQQGQDQGGQASGGQDQGQQQAAAPAQQAEPASVELGMTPGQVEAALGKPDKKVTLGAKQIYIYKDMKITFKDGKVSDVQ